MWYNRTMIGKRAIAFDIGNKRIGVAISDPFNEYAMPCETYVRTRNFAQDVAAIAKIARDRGVGVIVCGMPVNYDGTESIQTVKTREFVEALRGVTDLPIELEDERFTTMQARETQIMGGVKRDDRKKTIDSIAALKKVSILPLIIEMPAVQTVIEDDERASSLLPRKQLQRLHKVRIVKSLRGRVAVEKISARSTLGCNAQYSRRYRVADIEHSRSLTVVCLIYPGPVPLVGLKR